MEDRIKEIKNMYNDCAKSFNQYVLDHDLAAYNERCTKLIREYGGGRMIRDLLFWWGQRVQGLHDAWRKEHGSNT